MQQVWEWLDERRYRVHITITRQLADGWRCAHHVGLYRALTRAELTAALQAAASARCRWLMPDDSGYHQPLVLARPEPTDWRGCAMRVIVIGGGIMGLASAWALRRRGHGWRSTSRGRCPTRSPPPATSTA